MINILICHVRFFSKLPLEDLGEILSARVFGGAPFGGLAEFIRDEVPTIFTEPILGTRFLLMGAPDEEGYCLEAEPDHEVVHRMSQLDQTIAFTDVSRVIVDLMGGCPDIRVGTEGPQAEPPP